MKKIFAVLLAVTVALCCMFAAAAADPTYLSPTAPTIIPPHTEEPPTGEQPTSPTVTSPPVTSPPGTAPSPDTTSATSPPPTLITTGLGTTAARPTTGSGATTRPTQPTAPGSSTVTGTAKPDTSPDSPKTGDAGAEVFLFSAIAMTGACAFVLLRKKKDDAQ